MNNILTGCSQGFGQMGLHSESTTNRPHYNAVTFFVIEDLKLKASYCEKDIIRKQTFSRIDSWELI